MDRKQGSLFDGPGGTALGGMDEPGSLQEALEREPLEFNGSDYDPKYDQTRLEKQIGRVYEVVKDGQWRTVKEIQQNIKIRTGVTDPECSISAQLRHLRKKQFGGYCVDKRARGKREHGLFEYRLGTL